MTTQKPPRPPWPYLRWIAHRGAGRLAPENTLAAFRLGVQHGYRMLECDVKLSADGLPFLLHDDTLDRTTTGHGPASVQPWSVLRALDAGSWHSATYRNETLPTLAEVAAFCQQHACALNIEIKPSPGHEKATGHAVAQAAAQAWAGVDAATGTPRSAPLLTSFSTRALVAARQTAPTLPMGWLLDRWRDDWAEQTQTLQCQALVCHHSLWTAKRLQQARDRGLWTVSYTVNDAATAQQLLDWGVDAIITDAIDQLPPRT